MEECWKGRREEERREGEERSGKRENERKEGMTLRNSRVMRGLL